MKSLEVFTELRIIGSEINSLLKKTAVDDEVVGKIEFEDSADGRMYRNEIREILDCLESVKYKINYLCRPIISEGYLHKNSRGRYEMDGRDFTCGNRIEILITVTDVDEEERDEWRITRIEHDGDDYYAVGCKDLNLEGAMARIR